MQTLGPKIVARDMAPGFMIDLLAKDLKYTTELGADNDVCLLGTAISQQLFKAAQARGWGREGTQALYRVVESLHTK